MARKRRYHFEGCFYHVMIRGNFGQDIFFSDADRYFMAYLLQEGIEKYKHKIHAFCFMKNHIHLLIQVDKIPLAKIMHNLSFRYSQKINYRYNRVGRLFQGRYRAILLEEKDYFMRLLRYIHMNPVRAGITENPENYYWSSHNAYCGKNVISWLTSDYGLSKFDQNKQVAISLFRSYISKCESLDEVKELKGNFKDSQVLGGDKFLEEIRAKNEVFVEKPISIKSIVNAACEIFNIDETEIISQSRGRKISHVRALIAILARERGEISVETISLFMNRSPSTISSLIMRFNQKFQSSTERSLELKAVAERAAQIADCKA